MRVDCTCSIGGCDQPSGHHQLKHRCLVSHLLRWTCCLKRCRLPASGYLSKPYVHRRTPAESAETRRRRAPAVNSGLSGANASCNYGISVPRPAITGPNADSWRHLVASGVAFALQSLSQRKLHGSARFNFYGLGPRCVGSGTFRAFGGRTRSSSPCHVRALPSSGQCCLGLCEQGSSLSQPLSGAAGSRRQRNVWLLQGSKPDAGHLLGAGQSGQSTIGAYSSDGKGRTQRVPRL